MQRCARQGTFGDARAESAALVSALMPSKAEKSIGPGGTSWWRAAGFRPRRGQESGAPARAIRSRSPELVDEEACPHVEHAALGQESRRRDGPAAARLTWASWLCRRTRTPASCAISSSTTFRISVSYSTLSMRWAGRHDEMAVPPLPPMASRRRTISSASPAITRRPARGLPADELAHGARGRRAA